MKQDIETAEAIIEFNGKEQLEIDLDKYHSVFMFTTENIKGMLKKININQKAILTVSSSGDHIFNFLLYGTENIDAYDSNVFTKYFFYLKEAAIRTLSYEEFLEFFIRQNRFSFIGSKNKVFSDEYFWKIQENIRDKDSRIFWNYLFSKYGGKKIYNSSLFIGNNYSKNTYMECNNYLENENNYKALQQKLKDYQYKFYELNIFNLDFIKQIQNKKYNFIYLSNILDSLQAKTELQYVIKVKEILSSLKEILDKNGRIGVCYLYCYLDDYWHDHAKGNLKSISTREKYFKKHYQYEEFRGISNLKSKRVSERDALILTLKK